ncbi:MAG TPA: LuxR C-terminal-related transcriptional regulator [Chloroflexia bacterium]|nr:LuxR C-terminal-related transcriptional regulator [Chloroflexia bacterium]
MITEIFFPLEQNLPAPPSPEASWEAAANLLEECAENLLLTNQLNTLSGWLELLPPDLLRSHPRLGLYKALILLISGKLDEVETSVASLETVMTGYPVRGTATQFLERHKTVGEIAAIRSTLAILEHNLDRTIHLSDSTRASLNSESLNWWMSGICLYLAASYRWNKNNVAVALSLSSGLATVVANNAPACTLQVLRFMSDFYFSQGDLRLASSTCQHLLQLAGEKEQDRHIEIYRGYTALVMGKIAFRWNKLSEAGRFFHDGLDTGRHLQHLDIVYKAYSHLLQLKKAQGDLDQALLFTAKIEQLESEQNLKFRDLNRALRSSLLAALHSGAVLFPEQYTFSQPVSPGLLNKQEIEIINFLAQDFSNREIASRLIVTENTVKYHLKRIFQKLQVNDRNQAVKRCKELRLI